jgi:hypothetical protein
VHYIYTVPNGWVRFYCHVADHFVAQVVTYVVLGEVRIVGAIYDNAKEGSANNVSLGACSVFTRLGEEKFISSSQTGVQLEFNPLVPRKCSNHQSDSILAFSTLD